MIQKDKGILKPALVLMLAVIMLFASLGFNGMNKTSSANAATTNSATAAAVETAGSLSSSLADTLQSAGGKVAGLIGSWASKEVMNMIGMPDYETRVENKLNEISAKIDDLTVMLADIKKELSALRDLQNYTIVSNRMTAFETVFNNMNTGVNQYYNTLRILQKTDMNSDSYDAQTYINNVEYFVKLTEGKDNTVNIDDITGVGQFITNTLNLGAMILPSTTYAESIFGTAKQYFEYDKVWAHEAYDQRETFRAAVLGVYEKAIEICKTSILYRLEKTYGIANPQYTPQGDLIAYVDVDNLTDFEGVTGNRNLSGRDLYQWLTADNISYCTGIGLTVSFNYENTAALQKASSYAQNLYNTLQANYDCEIEFKPINTVLSRKIQAVTLMDTLSEIYKQAYNVGTAAQSDLNEVTENSQYRIHLKLLEGKVVVMNRVNRPFAPVDVVGSARYANGTRLEQDDFTLMCNGTTFHLNGYESPAVINTAFTPTSRTIFEDFLSYIPESYTKIGSTKTLYDYLTDNGFEFYDANGNAVTDGKLALGCNRYRYISNKYGYKLAFVYIDLSQKLSEAMSYKLTSAGQISDTNSGGWKYKYRYTKGFSTAMYNIGFPSGYTEAQISKAYFVSDIISKCSGVTFGTKTGKVASDSQDKYTTDNGENSVAIK